MSLRISLHFDAVHQPLLTGFVPTQFGLRHAIAAARWEARLPPRSVNVNGKRGAYYLQYDLA